MKRLILMRHAKTEPWVSGIDDFGRALTDRGMSDASRMATEIVARGWSPDLILVSAARRARETCSQVAEVVQGERVRPMEGLYLIGVPGIEDIVKDNSDVSTLMVIGHNPGLHDFALTILHEAGSDENRAARRLSEKFPTGCAAFFESPEDAAFERANFKLKNILRAKDFREAD